MIVDLQSSGNAETLMIGDFAFVKFQKLGDPICFIVEARSLKKPDYFQSSHFAALQHRPLTIFAKLDNPDR